MKKLTAIKVERATYIPLKSKGGKNPGTLLGNRIPDPEYPGLYLHVTPNGAKSWRYDFRWPPSAKGRRQTITYGRYPDFTLADARDEHREARRNMGRGINPAEHKQQMKRKLIENANNTFERASAAWYAEESQGKSKSWTESITRGLKLLNGEFGSKPLTGVTDDDISLVTTRVVKQGYAYTAERIRQLAAQVFTYALQKKYLVGTNPAENIAPIKAPQVKHNPHIQAHEIPDFVKAVDASGADERTKIAAKLLLLCFCRKAELLAMKWPEIDLNGALWEIPSGRTKNRLPHLVPISTQALEHFRRLRELAPKGTEYVFPSSRRPKRHIGLSSLPVFFHRIGYEERLTPHGLRSVASTKLNGTRQFSGDVIERQLGHVERSKVRGAYNKADYLPERTAAMQWWGDFVERTCRGEVDNVVQLAAKVA